VLNETLKGYEAVGDDDDDDGFGDDEVAATEAAFNFADSFLKPCALNFDKNTTMFFPDDCRPHRTAQRRRPPRPATPR
jgi:hypothetical protein